MNGMKFNLEKCCVMHCGKNNKKKDYKMFDKLLRKIDCEKDLGILVNPDMKGPWYTGKPSYEI